MKYKDNVMKKCFILASLFACVPALAMNDTANMLRRCEGENIMNADNYLLRCGREEKILEVMRDGTPMFFPADNSGDLRGSFLDSVPENDDYVYVNVVKKSPDTRYSDQICYRFITEKDDSRDGFYAVEVCEYERPDYYL